MNTFLNDLIVRYPDLKICVPALEKAAKIMIDAFTAGHRLYICGNGGSAADAEHIVGELMKGFVLKREVSSAFRAELVDRYGMEGNTMADHLQCGLPAIALTGSPALSTAFSNDVAPDMVFAQQLFALGQPGDVVIGISTSGNSKNVVSCLKLALARGIHTIAMTGSGGGECGKLAECLINVPVQQTFMVQEYHLPVYHALCLIIEDHFYGHGK